MRVSPIRLPKATTLSSPSIVMLRRNSLEDSEPYIFPEPYAHTIFFSDDSFLVFGDGLVPPPPGYVRYSDTEEMGTTKQEELIRLADAGPQEGAENVPIASAGGEGMATAWSASQYHYQHRSGNTRDKVLMVATHPEDQLWDDELDAHDDLHSSSSPTSASISISPSTAPSLKPPQSVRNEAGNHPVSTLWLEMFLNPNEVDRKINVESYMYGSHGAYSIALRSNIQTIIDPSISVAEQTARDRKRCRGMFCSFAEISDDF
ncbi:hypothetical protein G6011_04786 [Alternaria panax]|uniref:Uncharacterized protein n=1 Tax=Alternaria panax TaxID=48097 RepID=A0AAD4NT02_9PLEO|nr:hypothetical protein G6011_04786 [Alternaria panax]